MHQRKIRKNLLWMTKKKPILIWKKFEKLFFFLVTCPFGFFFPVRFYGSCSLHFTCIESFLFLSKCLSWSFHIDIRREKKDTFCSRKKRHSCAVVCLHLKIYLCAASLRMADSIVYFFSRPILMKPVRFHSFNRERTSRNKMS